MPNGRDTSWHAEARRLSEGGWAVRRSRSGWVVRRAGVYKALHPQRAKAYWDAGNRDQGRKAAKLEWEKTEKGRAVRAGVNERHRGACVECGAPLGATKWHGVLRCLPCEKARRREEHERLLDRVCDLYRAGKTYVEIAAAMGWKHRGTASPYVIELRERGRVTPRR
jgi:hypothetical protein